MRYFLSRENLGLAAKLAAQRTLCAFDYDGTLTRIVAHPSGARMRATTRRLLSRLAQLYPCVVISGRARRDLTVRLEGTGVKGIIGNHGAEPGPRRRGTSLQVKQWLLTLEPALAPLEGVWIENKEVSLAIHYREAPKQHETRRRILEAVAGLARVRWIGGKHVVNVVPADAPDKGHALAAERDRLRCDWILYVGDDDTDEDAFQVGGNMVAIRVGRKAKSRARYYLREQGEIDHLLRLLIDSRVCLKP